MSVGLQDIVDGLVIIVAMVVGTSCYLAIKFSQSFLKSREHKK